MNVKKGAFESRKFVTSKTVGSSIGEFGLSIAQQKINTKT